MAEDIRSLRVGALLKLSESVWKEIENRRSFQWKVSFGVWTALAAFAGTMLRGELTPPEGAKTFVCIMIAAIAFIYIVVWIPSVEVRQKENIATLNRLRNHVEDELELRPEFPPRHVQWRRLRGLLKRRQKLIAFLGELEKLWGEQKLISYASVTQFIVTGALTAIALFALYHSDKEKNTSSLPSIVTQVVYPCDTSQVLPSARESGSPAQGQEVKAIRGLRHSGAKR